MTSSTVIGRVRLVRGCACAAAACADWPRPLRLEVVGQDLQQRCCSCSLGTWAKRARSPLSAAGNSALLHERRRLVARSRRIVHRRRVDDERLVRRRRPRRGRALLLVHLAEQRPAAAPASTRRTRGSRAPVGAPAAAAPSRATLSEQQVLVVDLAPGSCASRDAVHGDGASRRGRRRRAADDRSDRRSDRTVGEPGRSARCGRPRGYAHDVLLRTRTASASGRRRRRDMPAARFARSVSAGGADAFDSGRAGFARVAVTTGEMPDRRIVDSATPRRCNVATFFVRSTVPTLSSVHDRCGHAPLAVGWRMGGGRIPLRPPESRGQ